MPANVAFDTNIFLYSIGGKHDETNDSPEKQALSKEENRKANIAKAIIARPSTVSIQVFNEFANVARRKLGLGADDVRSILENMARVHSVVAVTWETTRLALEVSKIGENRHADGTVRPGNFSTYDSLIVAAALLAECDTLYTEDNHSGLVVAGKLKIINPFA